MALQRKLANVAAALACGQKRLNEIEEAYRNILKVRFSANAPHPCLQPSLQAIVFGCRPVVGKQGWLSESTISNLCQIELSPSS